MKERKSPTDFYFDPESKAWEIDRENALVVCGGQRAILMQLAHPLVGHAVSRHSYFKEDAVTRLRHTLDFTNALVFGTKEEALDAARKINRAHIPVKGELTEGVGLYPAGTPYSAKNGELGLWVWSTLVDSALLVHDRFVRPLSTDEKEAYYQESKRVLKPLGVNPQIAPESVKDFSRYVEDMIQSGKLTVSDEARELAPYILLQKSPLTRAVSAPIARITIGLLPEQLREQFGFPFSKNDERFLAIASRTSRTIYPHLPGLVRFSPQYRRARRRLV